MNSVESLSSNVSPDTNSASRASDSASSLGRRSSAAVGGFFGATRSVFAFTRATSPTLSRKSAASSSRFTFFGSARGGAGALAAGAPFFGSSSFTFANGLLNGSGFFATSRPRV